MIRLIGSLPFQPRSSYTKSDLCFFFLAVLMRYSKKILRYQIHIPLFFLQGSKSPFFSFFFFLFFVFHSFSTSFTICFFSKKTTSSRYVSHLPSFTDPLLWSSLFPGVKITTTFLPNLSKLSVDYRKRLYQSIQITFVFLHSCLP